MLSGTLLFWFALGAVATWAWSGQPFDWRLIGGLGLLYVLVCQVDRFARDQTERLWDVINELQDRIRDLEKDR